ncbi:MAG: hypothetical protein IJ838_02020 [Paludibacteraceae bacterium]|nr:hypothetical protein [Paludibacteraceae bacterium]
MKRQLYSIFCLLVITLTCEATSVRLVAPNFGTYTAQDVNGQLYLPSETAYDIPSGTVLTFTTTPKNDCSYFAEWVCTGGTVSDNRLVVGDQAIILHARFQIHQYLIQAEVQPAEIGTATIKCGVREIYLSVAGAVNCGSRIQLTATQGSDHAYRFSHWDDGDTNAQRYVEADDNRTYTAVFVSTVSTDVDDTEQDKVEPIHPYIEGGLLKVEYNGHIYNAQGARIY